MEQALDTSEFEYTCDNKNFPGCAMSIYTISNCLLGGKGIQTTQSAIVNQCWNYDNNTKSKKTSCTSDSFTEEIFNAPDCTSDHLVSSITTMDGNITGNGYMELFEGIDDTCFVVNKCNVRSNILATTFGNAYPLIVSLIIIIPVVGITAIIYIVAVVFMKKELC